MKYPHRSCICILIASTICFLRFDLLFGSDGLRYEKRTVEGPLSIHLLYLDPQRVSITVVRALGKSVGRETVSSMARKHKALAAINGGFFRMGGDFDGEPLGILKIGSNWYSDSSLPRGAIGWNQENSLFLIERLQTFWQIHTRHGIFELNGLNRPTASDLNILYTSRFGGQIPTAARAYIRIDKGKISGIFEKPESEIYFSESVIAVGHETEIPVHELKVGDPISVHREFCSVDKNTPADANWENMEYIVGGTPVLIKSGRVVNDYSTERIQKSFITEKHPRTAVGVLPDGQWIFLVADGRRPDHSIGMTLKELTDYLVKIGCQDALNMDGGGSSTLVYKGLIRNTPSDPIGERPISDAILVLAKDR